MKLETQICAQGLTLDLLVCSAERPVTYARSMAAMKRKRNSFTEERLETLRAKYRSSSTQNQIYAANPPWSARASSN